MNAAVQIAFDASPAPLSRAAGLNLRFRDVAPEIVLAAVIAEHPGRVAFMSSFGAEAAVSLALLASVAPETPVLFFDTRMHFPQTLDYRDELVARLGLTDVRSLAPAAVDPRDMRNDLWRTNADACCAIRKVEPLAKALPDFDVLITGRKRLHGGGRARLPLFEEIDGVLRLNILVGLTPEELERRFSEHDLPRHPLVQAGFSSIGCWPCTRPAEANDEDMRAGRWAGQSKTECGLHLPFQGADI